LKERRGKMPAPRAILIDIMNLGLDPKKPHASLNKNGKLSQKNKKDSTVKQTKEATIKAEAQEKKEVKLPMPPSQEKKEIVEVVKEEVKLEATLQQEVANVETSQPQEEEATFELSLEKEEAAEVQTVKQTETKLKEVFEEKQPLFQNASQDRFSKKKNALKKM
jgi:hypothetical protein